MRDFCAVRSNARVALAATGRETCDSSRRNDQLNIKGWKAVVQVSKEDMVGTEVSGNLGHGPAPILRVYMQCPQRTKESIMTELRTIVAPPLLHHSSIEMQAA